MAEYNAGNRKDVRQAEKDAKFVEEQRQEIVGHILSTAASRRWMYDILSQCHIFGPSFSPDPYVTAFQEGERNVGLRLFADCQAHPDLYLLMAREANERYQSANNRRSRSSADENGADPGSDLDESSGSIYDTADLDDPGTQDRFKA